MHPSNQSVVYAIQQPRPKEGWTPNLQPATDFGRIEFIFDQGDRIYADPKAALKKARARLADFDPLTDYLLWPNFGDPAGQYLVCAYLTSLGYNALRWLYWSRGRIEGRASNENGYYVPITLDVSKENY